MNDAPGFASLYPGYALMLANTAEITYEVVIVDGDALPVPAAESKQG